MVSNRDLRELTEKHAIKATETAQEATQNLEVYLYS